MFEKGSINVPGARPQPAFVVHCTKCGSSEKVSVATYKGGCPPPEAVASKFRNLGWSLSNRGNADVCPSCQERKKAPSPKESNVVEMKIKAEPPREMSKEDQRIIFAEINDVYVDEKTGYSSGWNDKKVAEKLGVPLAWVKNVREAHFGKEGVVDDLKETVRELRKLLDAAVSPASELAAKMEGLRAGLDKLTERAGAAHGYICDIDVRLKALEKIVER